MESLSDEQKVPVQAALTGASLFLTGGAGTGKSHVLKEMIAQLQKKYAGRPGAVAVVAPTGIAAIPLEGTTIHAWAGLGPIKKEAAAKFHSLKRKVWSQVHVLVIDEIGMVDDWLLNLLDRLGKEIRNKPLLPFGGVQVIFCGDFAQLPPFDGVACFKSHAWKAAIKKEHCYSLSYSYRQGGDQEFASMLESIRLGHIDQWIIDALMVQARGENADGIEPTRLYTTRNDVGEENKQNLAALPGETYTFTARDAGVAIDGGKQPAWTNAPFLLQLKIGAQVMLLKNISIEHGHVNGARGIVVGVSDRGISVRFCSGQVVLIEPAVWSLKNDLDKVIACRTQYPLDLAWAITVHKSQGMSLDYVHADLSNCFATGMAYVALSRCRTLRGLRVTGLTPASIKADQDALAFHASLLDDDRKKIKVGF